MDSLLCPKRVCPQQSRREIHTPLMTKGKVVAAMQRSRQLKTFYESTTAKAQKGEKKQPSQEKKKGTPSRGDPGRNCGGWAEKEEEQGKRR